MKVVTKNEAYEDLANAIIVQAVKDYQNGYNREECMKFFKSDWYKILTDLPPERIIEICQQDVKPVRSK